MPPRRLIAASPDQAWLELLTTALQGTGRVIDGHRTLYSMGPGDLDAQLAAIHLRGEFQNAEQTILPRLPAEARAIGVIPRKRLETFVDLMDASERLAGIIVADEFDARQLSVMASRLLEHDIFGLRHAVRPGTEIHTQTVGDAVERADCLTKIVEFAERANVPRRFHESIEQCVDEMLMNALYDAPLDDHGKHVFEGIPTKTRLTMRIDQTVKVQYASDGSKFAVAVRDAFGSIERTRLLAVLRKCLNDRELSVERKTSGAGVGLFLMLRSATALFFHVVPGVTTEVVCVFDLEAARPQLQEFGFFRERADEAGVSQPIPAKNLRAIARPRGSRRAIAPNAMVALLSLGFAAVALIGLFVWHRLSRPAADPAVALEPDAAPAAPVATLALDSTPAGAAVLVDGTPMGSTPLQVTTLPPRADVTLTFKKPGFQDLIVHATVPMLGESAHLAEKLVASDAFARVHVTSEPAGAQVIQVGAPAGGDRTYTPADLVVPVDAPLRLQLVMPGHVPVVIEPFTPTRGAGVIEKSGRLPTGATLHIDGTGRASVSAAPHCADLALPADCVLAPGTYTVRAAGAATGQAVTMTSDDATVTLGR